MKKNMDSDFSKNTKINRKFIEIDRIDKLILNELQKNNQLTNLELSYIVNLSPPPCLRRVRRLRKSGIIAKDVSLVDPFLIKQNLLCFVSVSLEKQGEDYLERFEQRMLSQPEIKQCYFISGEVDYLLMVHVEDIDSYNDFVRRVFANSPNLKSFKSSFCLSRVKYDTSVELTVD